MDDIAARAGVAGQLRNGQQPGHIKSVDLRLTAIAIVGMLDNLCNLYLRDPQAVGRSQLVDILCDLLSSGLTVTEWNF